MVFLSEASIREMVQEALGGGGYPTLDGDGNFPIIPSPLAEPIVTKIGLQPVRVMRIPTDRHEFELAVKELVDGVEQDHLPTLFLKLRELVSDFVPEELESSPNPMDRTKEDEMAKKVPPPGDEMDKLRAEVRKMVRSIISEAGKDEDPEFTKFVEPFRVGGPKHIRPKFNFTAPKEEDPLDHTSGDDWDSDDGIEFARDVGGAETDPADDPYPEEYLKNQGYPDIGEDPDFDTWEEFEKDLDASPWNPQSELDAFRGRDQIGDYAKDALDAPAAPTGMKRDPISKAARSWEDVQASDDEFKNVGTTTLHSWNALAARKLRYLARELTDVEFENLLDTSTDEYIEALIKAGSERDDDGKPLLSMSDVMDLRAGSKFGNDDDGNRVRRKLDPEGEAIRKTLQSSDTFREFMHKRIVKSMEDDGYAYTHQDAAKDKDKNSVIHIMKKTSR